MLKDIYGPTGRTRSPAIREDTQACKLLSILTKFSMIAEKEVTNSRQVKSIKEFTERQTFVLFLMF